MSNKLNPQIQTTEVGVRTLRTVTIYPLSMADQFRLSDIVSEAIKEYSESEESEESPSEDENNLLLPKSEVEMFRAIMKLIEENLIEILLLVTDDNDKIELNDLTNPQFADLCVIIYEVNFDTAMGKLQSLFRKVKKALVSKRQPQKSSSKQTIDTNTSSDSHTELEE